MEAAPNCTTVSICGGARAGPPGCLRSPGARARASARHCPGRSSRRFWRIDSRAFDGVTLDLDHRRLDGPAVRASRAPAASPSTCSSARRARHSLMNPWRSAAQAPLVAVELVDVAAAVPEQARQQLAAPAFGRDQGEALAPCRRGRASSPSPTATGGRPRRPCRCARRSGSSRVMSMCRERRAQLLVHARQQPGEQEGAAAVQGRGGGRPAGGAEPPSRAAGRAPLSSSRRKAPGSVRKPWS